MSLIVFIVSDTARTRVPRIGRVG